MRGGSDNADVIVVGAGLAGLAAALRVRELGLTPLVLEAADGPGGRVRTDRIDGFTVDRGFQVVNSAYPELRRLGVLDGLDLRGLRPAAAVRTARGVPVVGDPRRVPSSLLGAVRAPLGSVAERMRLAGYLATVAFGPVRGIRDRTDVAFRERLDALGIGGAPTEHALAPFLSGVLADRELDDTSSRFADFVLRSFARGTVGVPAGGMGALPAVLATRLPAETTRYRTRVDAVSPGTVEVDGAALRARAVIVAADPVSAARLLGLPAPRMRGLVTVWHAPRAGRPRHPLIVVDGERGAIANSVPISAAAPEYAPSGRALIATTTLGTEPLPDAVMRAELSRLWGRDAGDWDEIAVSRVPEALPSLPGGSPLRRTVLLAPGLAVAGDWRDTPSIQGALVSGRRAADAVSADLARH